MLFLTSCDFALPQDKAYKWYLSIPLFIVLCFCNYLGIIKFDVNTAIWLTDLPGENIVMLDNLGWYCDITNIFIYQRQIPNSPMK